MRVLAFGTYERRYPRNAQILSALRGVGVEVVEDKRIPSSTDILATYETEVGMDGELVSYRRVKRYTRGRGDDGDA